MSEQPMIEWTSSLNDDDDGEDDAADIAVFSDGRLMLGPRFGGGSSSWHQLPAEDVDALRRFVFESQALSGIDAAEIEQEVAAAESRTRAAGDETTMIAAVPQRDAATTVIRGKAADRTDHEVRSYDLMGRAWRHPDVSSLQRLRAIELRLLELADEHSEAASGDS